MEEGRVSRHPFARSHLGNVKKPYNMKLVQLEPADELNAILLSPPIKRDAVQSFVFLGEASFQSS